MMQRRDFLLAAGAAGLLTGCAREQQKAATSALPEVRWRLASSFPKSLDTIYGAAEVMARRVAAATDGRFQIKVHAAGEIVPGLQVMDAVQQGTVECGHTASYYYVGKDMAFAFDTALPFGLNARQQNAWMYAGGGLKLMRELFAQYNIIHFPGGNTGVQMGGWFRKEIKQLSDLQGLKMRIPGLGGQIMAKLGAVPQTLAGADIYPALERGTIDAAEWVGPYDDAKLGFHKLAPHYYFPGWWEAGPQLSFYVNLGKWRELPPAYQAVFEAACAEANQHMLAEYDAKNPQALMQLVAQGVKLHAFPQEVMEAARAAAFQLYEEEAARNANFRRIYTEWKQFREFELQWFKVAELSYANFLALAR
ncbi:MAG: TRAP transporter substrate-binding protein [Thiobacillaceae bacterium]|nr:TRAP transporter substrate-binding protein [Thiobacillaceae bacterium]